MYKLMGATLLALIMIGTTGLAKPKAETDIPPLWLTDFAAAKKLAAEKKLPILADFSGSDWCGWCQKLDREVFSTEPFKDYAQQEVILFLADFPSRKTLPPKLTEQNEALAKTYEIRGFPTVLLLDAQGKVLARTGYKPGGGQAYVDHLKELLADAKPGNPAS